MLTINLIVIGERMPAWVDEGYAEYEKRIRGRVQLKLIEIPAVKRGKNADLARIAAEEDKRLLAAVPAGCRVIALDRLGKAPSTLDIVSRMEDWLEHGEQVALLVGGPEGLSNTFIEQADESWSLSELTFAHPVVRVLIAEQIYRCWSVMEGLPYHR